MRPQGLLVPLRQRLSAAVKEGAQLYLDILTGRLKALKPDGSSLDLEHTARRGQANGYASLGSDGLVPEAQLPPDGGTPVSQGSSLNAAAKFWFQIRPDGSAAIGVGTATSVGQVTGQITYRDAASIKWPDIGLAGTANAGYANCRTNNKVCRPEQSARHNFALLCSPGTANLRVWAAIVVSLGGGDTPTGAAMGMVYNPNVSTKWQVFCYSGSGSVYYADTGHTYTANQRVELSFLATGSGCTGKIRVAGGSWSTEVSVTSGVPTSTTAMYQMVTVSRITGGTTADATAYFVGSSAESSYV